MAALVNVGAPARLAIALRNRHERVVKISQPIEKSSRTFADGNNIAGHVRPEHPRNEELGRTSGEGAEVDSFEIWNRHPERSEGSQDAMQPAIWRSFAVCEAQDDVFLTMPRERMHLRTRVLLLTTAFALILFGITFALSWRAKVIAERWRQTSDQMQTLTTMEKIIRARNAPYDVVMQQRFIDAKKAEITTQFRTLERQTRDMM